MLNKSKSLLDCLNKNKINYCHWKSNEHIEEGLNGITDLDMLFDLTEKNKLENIFRDNQFVKCISQYGSRYKNVEDWIAYDENSGNLIHIHVHYNIITGHKGMKEYSLPWTSQTLKTKLFDEKNNAYIMEPNLELVTLYTRIGLKNTPQKIFKARINKYITSEDEKREINYLKNKLEWKIVEQICDKYYGRYSNEFIKIIKKDNLDSKNYLRLVKISSKVMKKYRNTNDIMTLLKKYYYIFYLGIFSLLKRLKIPYYSITRKTISKTNGKIIAFLGQDGAGKSTVSEEILNWLIWKFDAKKIYLGCGDDYNSLYKKIYNKISKNSNKLILSIRAILVLKDQVNIAKNSYKKLKIARKFSNKGGFIILDRFPQIQFEGINDGPKIRQNFMYRTKNIILQRIIEKFAIKEEKYLNKSVKIYPDIVFKLILSPEESKKRKPEEDYDLIKRKHDIINNLRFNNSKIFEIDAMQDYNIEIRKIKDIIWKEIQE